MGPEELRAVVEGLGLPKYRAVQLAEALYKQRVTGLEGVTTLPAAVRDGLVEAGYEVGLPEIVQAAKSVDGTERYLVRMADGETVETVWMPDGDGGERGDGSEAGEEEGREQGTVTPASKDRSPGTPTGNREQKDENREQGSGNREQKGKYGGPSTAPLRDSVGDDGERAEADSSAFAAERRTLRNDKDEYGGPSTAPLRGSARDDGERAEADSSAFDAVRRTLRNNKNKYGGPSTAALRASARDDGNKNSVVPDGSLGGYKRATICVSSQVGCAVNCQFCLTAKLGIRRNLTAGEIAGQVAAVLNRHKVRVGSGKGVETPSRINLVFMGMGEPFLNYDAFMKAVHLLRGMGIPESRMTVSTSGIEPAIRKFAEERVRPKLALSLNAPNDAIRREIMPITKKWDIAALLAALKAIPFGKREYVTFEYVLLGGINDRPGDAREVLALLKGMKAKVNLIVWNPGPGIDYHQPTPEDVAVFHRMLVDGGIPTFTRRPRGRDIYAACGQLKRTVSEEDPGLSLVKIQAEMTN